MIFSKTPIWAVLLLGSVLSLSAYAQSQDAILMVCTGNTGRSPMAEALANQDLHFAAANHPAFSRGIHVNPQKTLPEAKAVTVMRQWGINIAQHRAQPITPQDIATAEMVLTMTAEQKATLIQQDPQAAGKIFTLSECATGKNHDVIDAYGKDLRVYRQTRDQIAGYLRLIKQHHFTCVPVNTAAK